MRGSILDILAIFIITCVIIVAWLSSSMIYGTVKTNFLNTTNTTATEQAIWNGGTTGMETLVGSIAFVIIGCGLAAVVGAFLIPTHPIFFPISLFLLAVFTVLSAYFANMIDAFYRNPAFLPYVNSQPILVFLVNNYALYVLAVGALILLAQFGRPAGSTVES